MKSPLTIASSVNAFWNASSWSGSSCWMYLSPIPTCLKNSSTMIVTNTMPNSP